MIHHLQLLCIFLHQIRNQNLLFWCCNWNPSKVRRRPCLSQRTRGFSDSHLLRPLRNCSSRQLLGLERRLLRPQRLHNLHQCTTCRIRLQQHRRGWWRRRTAREISCLNVHDNHAVVILHFETLELSTLAAPLCEHNAVYQLRLATSNAAVPSTACSVAPDSTADCRLTPTDTCDGL